MNSNSEFRSDYRGQLSIYTKIDADSLMRSAIKEHSPVKIFCLVSGGNDSTAALIASREYVDAAVYIDTGTSLPGVEDHARYVSEKVGVPFMVSRAPQGEFERMVRDHGFPGPRQHRIAYVRLKERALDDLVRNHKSHRLDRIMLVTGVRRQESSRRMGTSVPVSRSGAKVWVAPIIDYSKSEAAALRVAEGISQSDVAALCHRSGECNCGAYAAPGEREMLKSLFPSWFAQNIERLEEIAKDAGHGDLAKWGHCLRSGKDDGAPGPMCVGCESMRLDIEGSIDA